MRSPQRSAQRVRPIRQTNWSTGADPVDGCGRLKRLTKAIDRKDWRKGQTYWMNAFGCNALVEWRIRQRYTYATLTVWRLSKSENFAPTFYLPLTEVKTFHYLFGAKFSLLPSSRIFTTYLFRANRHECAGSSLLHRFRYLSSKFPRVKIFHYLRIFIKPR